MRRVADHVSSRNYFRLIAYICTICATIKLGTDEARKFEPADVSLPVMLQVSTSCPRTHHMVISGGIVECRMTDSVCLTSSVGPFLAADLGPALPERVSAGNTFLLARDGFGVGEGGSSSSSSRRPWLTSGCWQRERVRIGERLKPFQRCGLFGEAQDSLRRRLKQQQHRPPTHEFGNAQGQDSGSTYVCNLSSIITASSKSFASLRE